MSTWHAWIERKTGVLFGTYRPTEPRDATWLVIAPATAGKAFSVVIGSRGFYITRRTKSVASSTDSPPCLTQSAHD